MASEISTNQRSSLPLASRETATLLDTFTSRIETIPGTINGHAISAACAPSDRERQALTTRLSQIHDGMRPASPEAIAKYVATLKMSGLVSRSTDEAGAAMEMRLTVKALEGFPEWAISDVCRRFLDGRLGKGRFVPTAAEIAQECRLVLLPHQEEAGRIAKVLDAEIYEEATPEQRDRIAKLLAGTVRELKAGMAKRGVKRVRRERSKEVIERAARIALIRQGKAYAANPVSLSPAAMTAMRRRDEDEIAAGRVPPSTHPATDRAA